MNLERILVVPDCHHPYVDRGAWRVLLAAGRAFKPHRIVVLGDFGDFYATSQHRKNPNRTAHLEDEVSAVNGALDELDALGAKRKHFLQGNHEENLERYLMDRAPELFNLIKVAELFRLAERGWTYTPYKQFHRVGKVLYTHDVGSAGARAHEQAEAATQSNIVIGHTHRAAVTYSGSVLGDRHVAIMSGWLGSNQSADYLHAGQKARAWQHAFTLGYREPNGVTHFQLVPIVKGKACVNGKIVTA